MQDPVTETSEVDLSRFRVRGEIPVPRLIDWLSATVILLLLVFSARAFSRGDSHIGYVLLAFAGSFACNSLLYMIIGREVLHRRGFILLVTLALAYFAIAAIEDGAAILWLFVYPPLVFYIHEARLGVIACLGGLASLALLFSPIGEAMFDTPYSASFRIVMISALAFEMASCYILDRSRRRSKLGLLRLASEFEFAAKHDALTGLANRREGHAQLDIEYERYQRSQRTFSVLLLDIDLFKGINDQYGHIAGDRMIVMVAGILREQCRKVDLVARWGGEEFLALLPETELPAACQTANRIRQAIATHRVEFEGHNISTTVSTGVAMIQDSESVDRLLQRADEALYAAKSAGRNAVFAYGKSGSAPYPST